LWIGAFHDAWMAFLLSTMLPLSILIARFLLPLNCHNIILTMLGDKPAVAVRRENQRPSKRGFRFPRNVPMPACRLRVPVSSARMIERDDFSYRTAAFSPY
jgi:hypothetical protein